jgi:septation ring formation regulator EzrA
MNVLVIPFYGILCFWREYFEHFCPSVQEEQRLRLRLSTLEQDLADKERQLQDAVSRQQELMERVNLLRSKEMNVKEENERLVKAKVTANHNNGISTCPEPNFMSCCNRWK